MADAEGIDTPADLTYFAANVVTLSDALLRENYAYTKGKMAEGIQDTLRFVTTEKRHAIYLCEMIKRGLL